MRTTTLTTLACTTAMLAAIPFTTSCAPETTEASLSREGVENIVRRSYQYVAMMVDPGAVGRGGGSLSVR
jgi:ATP-dependent protease Clp ATPase subunit